MSHDGDAAALRVHECARTSCAVPVRARSGMRMLLEGGREGSAVGTWAQALVVGWRGRWAVLLAYKMSYGNILPWLKLLTGNRAREEEGKAREEASLVNRPRLRAGRSPSRLAGTNRWRQKVRRPAGWLVQAQTWRRGRTTFRYVPVHNHIRRITHVTAVTADSLAVVGRLVRRREWYGIVWHGAPPTPCQCVLLPTDGGWWPSHITWPTLRPADRPVDRRLCGEGSVCVDCRRWRRSGCPRSQHNGA
jgi:hypothetical protein